MEKEGYKKQVLDLSKKLEEGVKGVFESEEYKKYLQVMSRFYHDYSTNNMILIAMQRPDASIVAGYRTWETKFDRHVVKDAKAIKILAPSPYKVQVENEKRDSITGKRVIGADGNPERETREVQRMGYRVAYVFDVKDTVGKPLPEFGPKQLTTGVENFELLYGAVLAASPVPAAIQEMTTGANGYFSPSEGRVVIKAGMEPSQTLKTALHETCHAICDAKADPALTRSDIEIRAEGTAYVVCQHFGIETGEEYSFPYIAGWSRDKDVSQLRGMLQSIQEVSTQIIDRMEEYIKEHVNEEDRNELFGEADEREAAEEGVLFAERIGEEGIEREFSCSRSR